MTKSAFYPAMQKRWLPLKILLASTAALLAGCARSDTYFGDRPSSRLSGPTPVATSSPPPAAGSETYGTYRGGRDPRTGLAPNAPPWSRSNAQVETLPPPAPAAHAGIAVAPRADGAITVQPGDTLYGLSKKHHVSISGLMAINRLSQATVQPGQMLYLR